MNKSFAILVLALSVFAAQAADKKKATAPAKPAAPVAKPLVIPKDATPNPNGTYSYTDKAGKKWIFSKTPFGISKTEDMTGAAPMFSAAPASQFITATDNGETVKFERQSPFGTTKWEKKKTELNEEELAAVARQAVKAEQKPE